MLYRSLTAQFIQKRHIHHKLKGYEFYEKTLGSPKHILGPMVEQSELAWRILSRRYDTHLCYTPMFHSKLFCDPINGQNYRGEQWTTNSEDRPLIVQFCANNPDILLQAARHVEHHCEAVDLNLGCPQYIAKKGRYGSFLQEDWETIYQLISTLDRELIVPITAKIRVLDTVEETINYAKMVQSAGAQLLTVHGRLREQKGHHTGLANWSKIKAVKEAVNIPVIANGNILYKKDVQRCLNETGADGVMAAEGHLYNPMIFSSDEPPLTWQMAEEYLDICQSLQPMTRPVVIKSHLFKLFHPSLSSHTDLRIRLGVSSTIEQMILIVKELKERIEIERHCVEEEVIVQKNGIREYPPWRCQPYFRTRLDVDHGKEKNDQRRAKALAAYKAKKAGMANDLEASPV